LKIFKIRLKAKGGKRKGKIHDVLSRAMSTKTPLQKAEGREKGNTMQRSRWGETEVRSPPPMYGGGCHPKGHNKKKRGEKAGKEERKRPDD